MNDGHAQQNTQARLGMRCARMIIVGFSCTQAFIYSTFYLIAYQIIGDSDIIFARGELLVILAWMIVAFALIYLFARRGAAVFFTTPALVIYVLMSIVGVLLSLFLEPSIPLIIVDGLCLGFPAAAMLCAWGSLMGKEPIKRSVTEVFSASAIGAIVCFILAALPIEGAGIVVCLMPIIGMLCRYRAMHLSNELASPEEIPDEAPSESSEPSEQSKQSKRHVHETEMSDEAHTLSGRILIGTSIYGLAAGLVETFAVLNTPASSPEALFLLLFVLYCLAALQLFGSWGNGRSLLPSRNSTSSEKDNGPLDASYRLAVLLMMAGFLLVPVLMSFSVSEESIVLAGYLGISTVLIALFLIMGYLAGRDATLSFARGFGILFAGEVVGIIVGNLIAAIPTQDAAAITIPVAGIAVLCGYLFLFTGDDLRALSVAVENADLFDKTCELIAKEMGLSKREAEILPMVLRGRTGERIAKELYITKNTVDTHIRRIYSKCNVHNRQELIDLSERFEREIEH